MAKRKRTVVAPIRDIARDILILRGQRVILDSDLAAIYGVSTGRLNEAVKRNIERFPQDFLLRLSAAEHAALISQNATSKPIEFANGLCDALSRRLVMDRGRACNAVTSTHSNRRALSGSLAALVSIQSP